MQFFYIDYMNNGKKERNIGFLRVENSGFSVGLRGVPQQCGDRCKVYVVDSNDEKILMGTVQVKGGYGMEKIKWNHRVDLARCMRVEIPLYGTRKGVCLLRDDYPKTNTTASWLRRSRRRQKVQNSQHRRHCARRFTRKSMRTNGSNCEKYIQRFTFVQTLRAF